MTYSIKKNCKQLKTTISQNQKKEDIFFSFEFLSALEESDCLDADSGWTPNYLVHETDAVIPFYEKENSHCLLYTSPSPRDISGSRMPSSA